MLYNAVSREDTFYLGELAFLDGGFRPENAAALFTLQQQNRFLDLYDPAEKQVSTCVMNKFGDWAVFDYHMLGYDPLLEGRDPILQFKLYGVSKSRMTLNGKGDLELFQAFNRQEAYSSGSVAEVGAKVIFGLGNSFMHYRSVLNWVDELTRQPDRKWAQGLGGGMAGKSPLNVVASLAGGFGFIDTFFGGAERATGWEPLNFTGQFTLQIEGDIEKVQPLWAYNFFLNQGEANGKGHRPVQKISWGILNFPTFPDVQINPAPPGSGLWCSSMRLRRDPGIVVNPHNGLELTSVKVAWQRPTFKLPDGSPITLGKLGPGLVEQASGFLTLDQAMATDIPSRTRFDFPSHLQWEIRFRIKEATRLSDRELVLIKRTGTVRPEPQQYRIFKDVPFDPSSFKMTPLW
jgi:hypothetical protein